MVQWRLPLAVALVQSKSSFQEKLHGLNVAFRCCPVKQVLSEEILAGLGTSRLGSYECVHDSGALSLSHNIGM